MERMHQLLSAVRRVNQVMVRERDPRRLVERACALLVEHSGVEAAWVSLLDEHGRPGPPLGAGAELDAAGLAQVVVEHPNRLPCMRTALWDTTPGVRLLRAVECGACPVGTGCARDALAVPLVHAGRAFGVLVVRLPKADAEASIGADLLEELAADLAVALHAIDAEQRHGEARRALARQVALERLLMRHSAALLAARPEAIEDAVARLVADVGRHIGASVGTLYRLSEDGRQATALGTWVDPSLGGAARPLRTVTVTTLGWWVPVLRAGDAVVVDDVEALPAAAEAERTLLRERGLRAAVGVPVRSTERLEGCLVFANGPGPRLWPEHVIHLLRFAGDLAANALARAQAEQRLRTSESWFRSIFEGSTDAVVILDPDGRVVDANPAAAALTGRAADVLRALHLDDLGDGGPCRLNVATVLAGEDADLVVALTRPDGSVADVRLAARRVTVGARDFVHVTARDVTEALRHERERAELQGRLLQAQKLEAIGTLAGGIAHDFNNLLGPIVAYADLLLEDLDSDEDTVEMLRDVRDAGRRAAELVEQILRLARTDGSGRARAHLQPVAKEALKLLRRTMPRSVTLTTHVSPTAPAVVCDPTEVHRVLMALVTNALQAMDGRDGTLEVALGAKTLTHRLQTDAEVLPPGPYLRLRVRDTGAGMTPEVRARIFEPYFSTRDRARGTGLGLAVVRAVAVEAGGGVHVDSEPGVGTCVDVYLPVAHDTSLASQPTGEIPVVQIGGRVLCVDDEPANVALMVTLLRSLGYSPRGAASPRAALDMITAEPEAYAALVTDLSMPEMSGLDLARAARAVRDDLPVVVCSGFFGPRDERQVSDLGAATTLAKPFERAAVARALAVCRQG
ncbi:MAG: response regulator [Myxococcales bacterium]|nr:response regulator [Myxococcales bacterium]